MQTNSQKTENNSLVDKPNFNHSLTIVGVLILSLLLASLTGVQASTTNKVSNKVIPAELSLIFNN